MLQYPCKFTRVLQQRAFIHEFTPTNVGIFFLKMCKISDFFPFYTLIHIYTSTNVDALRVLVLGVVKIPQLLNPSTFGGWVFIYLFFLSTVHKDVKNIYYFNDKRETPRQRGKRYGKAGGETEFFILFIGMICIILMSYM